MVQDTQKEDYVKLLTQKFRQLVHGTSHDFHSGIQRFADLIESEAISIVNVDGHDSSRTPRLGNKGGASVSGPDVEHRGSVQGSGDSDLVQQPLDIIDSWSPHALRKRETLVPDKAGASNQFAASMPLSMGFALILTSWPGVPKTLVETSEQTLRS